MEVLEHGEVAQGPFSSTQMAKTVELESPGSKVPTSTESPGFS